MGKLPRWLLAIDPDAKLEKGGDGWVATVRGGNFYLGRTKAEWNIALNDGRVLLFMRAAAINAELGLLPHSNTGVWVIQGHDDWNNPFTMDDAKCVATKILHRHNSTDYDDLLRAGFSRDEARELMA